MAVTQPQIMACSRDAGQHGSPVPGALLELKPLGPGLSAGAGPAGCRGRAGGGHHGPWGQGWGMLRAGLAEGCGAWALCQILPKTSKYYQIALLDTSVYYRVLPN